MVALQWGELKFCVEGNKATLFDKLKITAECETEDKDTNSQQYVSATAGKPILVTFTAMLSAYLGVDVRTEAMKMLNSAQRSTTNYLYVGGEKIFPFLLMMTKAEISEVETVPGGKWTGAQIAVTLQQSGSEWMTCYTTYGSSSASSSDSSSSGGSSYSGTSSGSGTSKSIDHAVKATASTVSSVKSSGFFSTMISNLKTTLASAKTKTSTTTGGVVTAAANNKSSSTTKKKISISKAKK